MVVVVVVATWRKIAKVKRDVYIPARFIIF